MTELETRLDEALKADAPPSRDAMFRIAVMERRTRTALRRRLAAGSVLALGVAILGAAGLAAAETLPDGPGRLAAMAVIGAVLTALLAAPHLGGAPALRSLMTRASWTLRTLPRPRLWP
jgi:peptidoglycan/LPS O-acetylase OafA/YrhL